MSAQKAVTTEVTNMLGEKVILRICSDPPPNARKIYQALNYTTHPFRKIKICSTQQLLKKSIIILKSDTYTPIGVKLGLSHSNGYRICENSE